MHLVTGGAGFIGSNIVADLTARGQDVAVCDLFGIDDKWKNLRQHKLADIINPADLEDWLKTNAGDIESVIHMGAISATTERDVDLIIDSNFILSKKLWQFCAEHECPFLYASSAATYGDGTQGFSDRTDNDYTSRLMPMNPYGWSKHLFDRWALDAAQKNKPTPPKWAGLKFFNVYGPNEYHKGSMKSVIAQNYATISRGEPIRLFKSYKDEYPDGGQLRDFVYVEDCVQTIRWMLDHDFASDIYNIGTGQARSWLDLAHAMFDAMGKDPEIEFIEMPIEIRDRYQYYTQADMEKLKNAGYLNNGFSLEDGVKDYIQSYLSQENPYR